MSHLNIIIKLQKISIKKLFVNFHRNIQDSQLYLLIEYNYDTIIQLQYFKAERFKTIIRLVITLKVDRIHKMVVNRRICMGLYQYDIQDIRFSNIFLLSYTTSLFFTMYLYPFSNAHQVWRSTNNFQFYHLLFFIHYI